LLLGEAIEILATYYEKFGNIPLFVETPTEIDYIAAITHDVAGVRKRGVSIVFETRKLVHPVVHKMHAVPPGDNSDTQEIVIPTQPQPPKQETIQRAKTVKASTKSGRHRSA
jgi:hypothetical protein